VRDILPSFVIDELRDHYYARVGQAEATFRHSQADEDSLTGALGQALLTPQRIVASGVEQFVWSTTYKKVRGRGRDAPEKRYGIDGIFELEVVDTIRGFARRKGLLFQAKKGWQGVDQRLVAQTRVMRDLEPDSVVVDYADGDYRAFDARDVIEAGGRRELVPADRQYALAKVLGDQFLECERGVIDLVYDPIAEVVHVPRVAVIGPERRVARAQVDHAVVTQVARLR
jgi:hypothetical protein